MWSVDREMENRVLLHWSSNVHWFSFHNGKCYLLLAVWQNRNKILFEIDAYRMRHCRVASQRLTAAFTLTLAGKLYTTTSVLVYVAYILKECGLNDAANLMHFHHGYFHSTFQRCVSYDWRNASERQKRRCVKTQPASVRCFFIYNGDPPKIAKCSESKIAENVNYWRCGLCFSKKKCFQFICGEICRLESRLMYEYTFSK